MKLVIGSDHGGFEAKEKLKGVLQGLGHEVTDFGCYSLESVDYPDVAQLVAEAVTRREFDRGVLVDGFGGAVGGLSGGGRGRGGAWGGSGWGGGRGDRGQERGRGGWGRGRCWQRKSGCCRSLFSGRRRRDKGDDRGLGGGDVGRR